MNRRSFIQLAASALVVPYVPERIYSFPSPRVLHFDIETSERIVGVIQQTLRYFAGQQYISIALMKDDVEKAINELRLHGSP